MNAAASVLLVAAGGFAGAIARYRLSAAIGKWFPSLLPYGTLTINALGSLLLGIIAGHNAPDSVRLLLGTGFMGAFTTFSTFKLESVRLARQRAWSYFALYLIFSYAFGIVLATIGFYMI
jgi:CrcB protein